MLVLVLALALVPAPVPVLVLDCVRAVGGLKHQIGNCARDLVPVQGPVLVLVLVLVHD